MNTIYILGEPGVGKSTLVKELTSTYKLVANLQRPIPHTLYRTPTSERCITLGAPHPTFPGTDTLPFNAINQMERLFLQCTQHNLNIIGEGDRLANQRFIELARNHGDLHLYYLVAPPAETAKRRQQRSQTHNTKQQDTAWVKGRQTKHSKLAAANNAITLDATKTPKELAAQIHADRQSHEAPHA